MHKTLIAYYRVSTQKQGRSGLGLEAQQTAIANFAKAEGLRIIGEYTEIETGKGGGCTRPPTEAGGGAQISSQTRR
jgi:DNA invertase Pin-like site-specific DNA recombinase